MKFQKFFNSNPFYVLLSFLFAFLIFANANITSERTNILKQTSEQYKANLVEIPIQVEYDDNKYYVYGYVQTAKVNLESSNRMRLASEENKATRTFRVTADLKNLKKGTHDVALHVEGLKDSVKVEIEPKTISVTIEKRVSKVLEVKPNINTQQIGKGLQIGKVSVTPNKVRIVTGGDILKKIDHLEVDLPAGITLLQNYSDSSEIRAVDGKNQPLSIKATPAKANLKVEVFKPSKKVDLVPLKQGDLPEFIKDVNIRLDVDEVKISGSQRELNRINVINVPIDVSKITTNTTLTVSLEQNGVTIEPSEVKVFIEPVFMQKSSTFSREISSSTTTSSEQPFSSSSTFASQD